ncbi:hypothetical protein [Flexivirga oryzae]|uniref:Antitoxin (DNA-binding transcriptional repressor) of toxin-antitoxin stability system n=1 Tax=Flexivirga oryzae TaxID=1794944 RepID=A0A839MZH0_9MICO|nr:hypothetical protein [Flexivirga oryzae]MBB2890860.1 antitoxin (DNA-binding transcriptional repressor) of toxin-antitoxin stability system [Flexivirga oryzae]
MGSTQIYTMRELNHDTPQVIREINESGKPAAITRRGRFVALITPLANSGVESAALAAAVEAAPDRAQILGEENVDSVQTPDQVAADLDITLPVQD